MEFCYGCCELVRLNFYLEFLDNSVINCGFIVFVKTVSLVSKTEVGCKGLNELFQIGVGSMLV